MKKVLVTGASGFIGKKVALHFKDMGYEVIGWVRKHEVTPFFIETPNMNDVETLVDALDRTKPDIVIHCAGSADVGKSVKNPEIDFQGNVVLTHNLLFAMHKLEMKDTRFVFLSSAGVYGNPKELPITEETELNPLSPYALHKLICEDLCKYFISNYGMNIKIARIFSAYGPGLKKQIFWDMYNKAQSGNFCILGTGNESRDYIHINDVVKALYLIATVNSKDVIFNVANGEEVLIREVTELFANAIGISKDKIKYNGVVREGDPLNWKADIDKIAKLGYTKCVSIEDGINSYVEWCTTTN